MTASAAISVEGTVATFVCAWHPQNRLSLSHLGGQVVEDDARSHEPEAEPEHFGGNVAGPREGRRLQRAMKRGVPRGRPFLFYIFIEVIRVYRFISMVVVVVLSS